ncbi:Uncharacterised protein [Mycoplasmopsis maculosa]|uniref:Uncharacterized protein n=1 Tax=Mycoplasmopsis maculosa TaxID=114885 RepID=A0A449B428_9BACT|nr:bacteriocin [Mycoplasmopsis maculosa]VEU75325.1 Uncharacterised protein [Mycoplasmopsis maculosa]
MNKTNLFKKINENELANISGGSAVAIISTIVPLALSAISAIASVVKMFQTNSGEIKNKDNSIKWNEEKTLINEKNMKNTEVKYIQPVYVAY